MRIRVALVAVLVSAGALAIARGCSEQDPSAPSPKRAPEPTLEPGPTAPGRPRAGRPTAPPPASAPVDVLDAPPAEPGPARLRVRVTDASGVPVGGAHVVVGFSDRVGGWFAEGRYDELRPPTAPVVTDAEGRAELEAPHFWLAFAMAWEGDRAGVAKRAAIRAGGEGAVEIALLPAWRVRGVVEDLDGRRVADARVRLIVPDVGATLTSSVGPYGWTVEPTELEGGSFAFPPVLPIEPLRDASAGFLVPEGVTVQAEAEGHLPARRVVTAQEAGGLVRVVLHRTGTVRGRVVDGSGAGVAGVAVARRSSWDETPLFEPREWGAVSGPDGRFEIGDFPELGGVLDVRPPAHAPQAIAVPRFVPEAGHVVGDVLLDAGLTLTGRVVDSEGQPVAGAHVWVGGREARADADGCFVAAHLPSGPWDVVADEGIRSARREGVDGPGPVEVVLSNARIVRAEVVFGAGEEPTGDHPYLRVTLRPWDAPTGSDENERWAYSRWSFAFRPEQPGRWIFRAEMAGYEPAEVAVDVHPELAVRVVATLRRAR